MQRANRRAGTHVHQDARRRARRRQEAVEAEGHRPRARRQHRARRSGPAAPSSSDRSRATTRTACRASARRSALRSALAQQLREGAADRGRQDRDRRRQDQVGRCRCCRRSAWSSVLIVIDDRRIRCSSARRATCRPSRCCAPRAPTSTTSSAIHHLVRDAGGGRRAAREGGAMRPVYDVITLAADHREGHDRQRARQPGRLPGAAATPTRTRSSSAVETLFKVKVEKVRTANLLGKMRRVGRTVGQPAGLEEGVRDARRGPAHRLLRATCRNAMPHPPIQADLAGPPLACRSPTSPRSPRRRRSARCSRRASASAAATRSAASRPATAAAATSAAIGSIDFRRNKDGVPAQVAAIEYDPNRSARLALLHYADGEKRYILAPVGLRGRATGDRRARRRHQAGQRAAAPQHSARHHGAQHRAAARQGRPDGPQRRLGDPADGQGRRACAAQAAVGRAAPGAGRVPRHHRPGRQPRSREHLDRQGRPHPLARAAARACAASR